MTDSLDVAIAAAREAGGMLRERFADAASRKVDEYAAHDIKLALDVTAQNLITDRLLGAFPGDVLLGEEGNAGTEGSEREWIVDPIDGTVNFFYGIPHFCVSIALRAAGELLLGVIYDPMRDELWQGERGKTPALNGRPIAVSQRADIGEAALTIGFAKTKDSIDRGLPLFTRMVYRARKCRMMGSAALDMAYIAAGRIDGYIEQSISLWDVAAGIVLIEGAGGRVQLTPHPSTPNKFAVLAWNGRLPLEAEAPGH